MSSEARGTAAGAVVVAGGHRPILARDEASLPSASSVVSGSRMFVGYLPRALRRAARTPRRIAKMALFCGGGRPLAAQRESVLVPARYGIARAVPRPVSAFQLDAALCFELRIHEAPAERGVEERGVVAERFALLRQHHEGARDMDSTPPAMPMSSGSGGCPSTIAPMAFIPDPQDRSMVVAATLSGSPASSADTRDVTHRPRRAGFAQPYARAFIEAGSSHALRSTSTSHSAEIIGAHTASAPP